MDAEFGEIDALSPKRRGCTQKRFQEETERILAAARFADGEEESGPEPQSDIEIASLMPRPSNGAEDSENSDRAAEPARDLNAALSAREGRRSVHVDDAFDCEEAPRRHVAALHADARNHSCTGLDVLLPRRLPDCLSRRDDAQRKKQPGDGRCRPRRSGELRGQTARTGGATTGTIRIPSD